MRAKYVNMGDSTRGVRFFCLGCQENHIVRITGASPWGFNNNLDRPTVTPSILITSGHYLRTPPVVGDCYCDWSKRFPNKEPTLWKCKRCHSFVTDGRIIYLPDCSHALKGQTIDLPDIVLQSEGTNE